MSVSWNNAAKFLVPVKSTYKRLHDTKYDNGIEEDDIGFANGSARGLDTPKIKENKGRGRPRKYESVEERKIAKDLQTINSHKRKHELRANIKTMQSPEQKKLIRYLQENVIDNIPLLDLIYNRLLMSRIKFKNELIQLGIDEDKYYKDKKKEKEQKQEE
jgi:hypothetical protein